MKNPYANLSPVVWLLAVISLINKSGAMVVLFFPIYLTQQLGFDIILTGEVLSIYGMGYVIGAYLGGTLTDKIGFLTVQICSLFFTGVLYLVLEHLRVPATIITTMFTIGVVSACLRPATGATISKFAAADTRAQAYSLNYQAINLGSALGPAIGGALATLDYAWLFRVDGAVNLIAALAMWLFFRNRHDEEVPRDEIPELQIATSWWRNLPFVAFLMLTFLIGLIFLLLLNLYPLFLKDNYTLSNLQIGMVLGFNGLIIILLQMHLSIWLKNFNLLHIIATGGLLLGIGYAILPLYSGFYFAFLSITIITLGEMTTLPQLNYFLVKIAPRDLQGKYFGLMNSAYAVPLVLAPSLGAYVYTHYGANTLWYGVGLLSLVLFTGFECLRLAYRNIDLRA
jgi:predicted MFS family arabinose efflux permease